MSKLKQIRIRECHRNTHSIHFEDHHAYTLLITPLQMTQSDTMGTANFEVGHTPSSGTDVVLSKCTGLQEAIHESKQTGVSIM